MHIVDEEIPFSGAPFWELQKQQFKELGIKAWTEQGVPLFPTNNPLFAKQAATVIAAFLETSPYILELGGGSGRFAYLLIKELKKITNRKFCYILTDIAPSLLSFWQEHPQLQEYIRDGFLKTALFDPLHDTALPIAGTHPLFVIASYFFDTIPQDSFKLENKCLYHELFKPVQDFVPCTSNDPILETIRTEYNDGYFLYPIGAFKTIDKLQALSGGRFVLLSSDRGNIKRALSVKKIDFGFKGSLSFPVDFHLLDLYVQRLGGSTMIPEHPEERFIVHLSLLGNGFEKVGIAFQEAMNPFNPGNYCTLINHLENSPREESMAEILEYFQISHFDPCLISLFATRLSILLEKDPHPELIDKIYDNFFVTCYQDSFAVLTLGLLLFAMKAYAQAILYFERALAIFDGNILARSYIERCQELMTS